MTFDEAKTGAIKMCEDTFEDIYVFETGIQTGIFGFARRLEVLLFAELKLEVWITQDAEIECDEMDCPCVA